MKAEWKWRRDVSSDKEVGGMAERGGPWEHRELG